MSATSTPRPARPAPRWGRRPGTGRTRRTPAASRTQDGLQRFGVFQRVLAGDGHLAVGDFGLHGRGGLHLAVQDDDDLAVVGHQIARGVGEGLGALRVQRDVHAVVGAALALAADGDVGDVGAGDDGRVGARLHGHVLHLARGEGVAELVGHRALAGGLAGVDGVAHLFVGERIQTRELQRAGAPDGGERLFRIGQAGNLHEDLIGALLLHRGLRSAQCVHAALDDGAGLLHVLGGDRRAVRGFRREDHRQAALDIETLVDLLVRRGEQHHRHDDEQSGEDEQPHVAAIRRAGRLLLDVAFQCHGMRPSSFAFLVSRAFLVPRVPFRFPRVPSVRAILSFCAKSAPASPEAALLR